MTPEQEAQIAEFCAERNEMLLACDVDVMLTFHAKWNPTSPGFSSREVAEIALHKAITGVKTLPAEHRNRSFIWLKDRGYTTFDDGDLTGRAKPVDTCQRPEGER